MSFAAETKAALCELKIKKMCCRTALLLGILRAANLFSDREIRFTTRSRQTAALTVSLLIECFGDI
ncbi:MAG: DNA-binding protein WhiA, partial [Clostridia bacterium]|nr:DNA-binding protein WhiA [Clostridia bacterium]